MVSTHCAEWVHTIALIKGWSSKLLKNVALNEKGRPILNWEIESYMRDNNKFSSQTETNGGEISSPLPLVLSDFAFVIECFGTKLTPRWTEEGLVRNRQALNLIIWNRFRFITLNYNLPSRHCASSEPSEHSETPLHKWRFLIKSPLEQRNNSFDFFNWKKTRYEK